MTSFLSASVNVNPLPPDDESNALPLGRKSVSVLKTSQSLYMLPIPGLVWYLKVPVIPLLFWTIHPIPRELKQCEWLCGMHGDVKLQKGLEGTV